MKCFSLDVECCKGVDNNLLPISIALVDQSERVLVDTLVKPDGQVLDYLTSIHGIRKEDLDKAPNLSSCLTNLRQFLSQECRLVGQSVDRDIEYLKLVQGTDFGDFVDIALYFALTPIHNPIVKSHVNSPRRFTLEQTVRYLLTEHKFQAHNPVEDAKAAMKLYLKYKDSPSEREEAKHILRHNICPEKVVHSSTSYNKNNGARKKLFNDRAETATSTLTDIVNSEDRKSDSTLSSSQKHATRNQQHISSGQIHKVNGKKQSRILSSSHSIQPPPFIQSSFENYSSPMQAKMIVLYGNLSDIVTKVKVIGKPNTKHIFTIQSPELIRMERADYIEPIEFFQYPRVRRDIITTHGFFQGAFRGDVESVQQTIDSISSSSLMGLLTPLCITFHLTPLEAYIFCNNDDNAIVMTTINSLGIEDHFAELTDRLIKTYPELKPTKFMKIPSGRLEWEYWLELLENKLRVIQESSQRNTVSPGLLPTPTVWNPPSPTKTRHYNPLAQPHHPLNSQPPLLVTPPSYVQPPADFVNIPIHPPLHSSNHVYFPPHPSFSNYSYSHQLPPRKFQYQPVSRLPSTPTQQAKLDSSQ